MNEFGPLSDDNAPRFVERIRCFRCFFLFSPSPKIPHSTPTPPNQPASGVEEKIERLNDDMRALNTRMDRLNDDLRALNAKMDAQMDALTDEMKSLDPSHPRFATLQLQLHSMEKDKEALRQDKEALRNQLAGLEEEKRQLLALREKSLAIGSPMASGSFPFSLCLNSSFLSCSLFRSCCDGEDCQPN